MNDAALRPPAHARARRGDLRAGEPWLRRQRAKNAVLYVLVRAALAAASIPPLPVLRALGRGLGAFAFRALRRERRIAEGNLRRVFPDLAARARDDLLARCYRGLGEHLADAVAKLDGGPGSPLPFEATQRETLVAALGGGRGCIFASAHLGPWERVASTLVASGFPLTTLARESYDPRLTRLYDRLRGRGGVASIYRGSPGAALRIVRTLRRGGLLGAPMDLRSRVASIEVPFLGEPAPTPVGPARIALRTGAAVVVGSVAPRAGDSVLELTVTRIPTADLVGGADGERRLTERINAEISRRILAYPEGWVWMHERWPSPDDPGPPAMPETR